MTSPVICPSSPVATDFRNGIVAAQLPIAAGVAFAEQYRGTDNIVACFFGDGAVDEGAFHEALNLASVWKLPVVYLCENNQYAMSMPIKHSINIEHISQRAHRYERPEDDRQGRRHAARCRHVRRAGR